MKRILAPSPKEGETNGLSRISVTKKGREKAVAFGALGKTGRAPISRSEDRAVSKGEKTEGKIGQHSGAGGVTTMAFQRKRTLLVLEGKDGKGKGQFVKGGGVGI